MSRFVDGQFDGMQNTSYPSTGSSGSVGVWLFPLFNSGDSKTREFWTFAADGSHDAPGFQRFSDNNIYAGFAGFGAGDQRIIISDSGLFTASTWAHWLFTWTNGGTHKLYKNGVLVGSRGSSTANGQAGFITVGNLQNFLVTDAAHTYFAELTYWNAQLTDDDAAYLGYGGRSTNINPAALVGYWPLKGVDSPEPDLVGGKSLTLTGSIAQGGDPPVIDWFPTPPVYFGPPDIQSPIGQNIFVEIDVFPTTPPPTPPPPPASPAFTPPLVHYGPPDIGAPFSFDAFADYGSLPTTPAPPPPVVSPVFEPPDVTIGPPIPGSPFFAILVPPLFTRGSPFVPPPVPPSKVKGLQFVQEVPVLRGISDVSRLRQSTVQLAGICNSLIRKGQLVLDHGVNEWTLNASNMMEEVDLTGTFNMGTFAAVSDSGTFNNGTFTLSVSGGAGSLNGTFNMGTFP